jgi:hypothetical protein
MDRETGVVMQSFDISCCLGSFVRVGNFMWNESHNITLLAWDKFAKICMERPNGTDLAPADSGFTNEQFCILTSLFSSLRVIPPPIFFTTQLDSMSSDTKVTFRKKANPHNPDNGTRMNTKPIQDLKVSLAPRRPYGTILENRVDDRSPVDAKQNAPFVANFEMGIDAGNFSYSPYRKLLKEAFGNTFQLNHSSAVIFASFGVAGIARASYENTPKMVDEAYNTLLDTMRELFRIEHDDSFRRWISRNDTLLNRRVQYGYKEHRPLF